MTSVAVAVSRMARAANHCSKVANPNEHLRSAVLTKEELRMRAATSAGAIRAGSTAPPVRMVSTPASARSRGLSAARPLRGRRPSRYCGEPN